MNKKKIYPGIAQLGHLDNNERNKLLKQASKLRKLAAERGGRKPSLEDVIKQLSQEPATPLQVPTMRDTAVWIGKKTLRTLQGHEAELNGHRCAVGDEVHIADHAGHLRVAAIEPRRTSLGRPDVNNPHLQQVIVANVDVVVVTVSVATPPLHPRLIDRYLIAIQAGGAEPLLAVNKLDALDSDPAALATELAKLEPYAGLGLRIMRCSAATGRGIDELRHALVGKTCAFVGHSGVGKSSLVNALFPDLGQKVGELSSGYGRGAHTTTWSSLFDVGNGTRLIDTPGIRSFGLGRLTITELQASFSEFEPWGCRFRDCTHVHEPGCGVRAAVEVGDVSAVRFETYRRLMDEVAR
ncbi:MAG: ribosome small subunit-dependent GTPase A [Fimbriimonadales bacterium]